MEKNLLKKALVTVSAMMMLVGVVACGNGADSKNSDGGGDSTGYYASTTNVKFTSAYPEHTFKQATFGVQTLETFSDNTYCLTDTETFFSGELEFNDNGKYDVVPRGANIVKYYGSVVSADEEGLITLELSKPTAVITHSSYSAGSNPIGYLNTHEWTEQMGQAVAGEGPALSADEYLESKAFSDTTVIIDSAQASFDYVVIEAAKAAN